MKKSLLALAVLGAFAGAASAQSSVTLYGIIDVNYQYTDFKRDAAATVSGINSGHRNGSRLGVRGSESLGGGLNAIFQIENGFSADTGQAGQGGRLFGRQAYAGLSGGFGAVVAGRLATFSSGTGAFDLFGDVDPFYTGFGLASLGSTFSSAASLRADNTIAYRTPNISGFQGGVGYSFRLDGAEAAGSGNNNRAIISGATYRVGPIVASITYDRVKFANATPQPQDQSHLQIGAKYNFGIAWLHAAYAKEDNQRALSVSNTTNGADASAWMIGTTIPFGPTGSNILASYQKRDGKRVGTDERDRRVMGIGYEYAFSRRTLVHVTFADSKGSQSLAVGTAATDAFNRRELTLGMTHFF